MLRATLQGAPDSLDRNALLGAVADGRDVRLFVDIIATEQSTQPNRNFTRFTADCLTKMAASFVGKPFLRDHAQNSVEDRGGRIVASEFIGQGEVGHIRQTIEVSAPWAVEALARDLIDAFSIGWWPNDTLQPYCSIDGQSLFSIDCPHMPGDVVEYPDGSTKTVEMIYTDVDGIETSAVNTPAVRAVGIEAIRAALAAQRAGTVVLGAPITQDHESAARRVREALAHQKENQMKNIATKLGLADTADEPAIMAAVDRLKTEHATLAAAHSQTKDALSAAQSRLDKVEAEANAAKLEALIEGAYRDGKIAGEKGKNDLEKSVRELAALSFSGADAFVRTMPKVVPIGKPASEEVRAGRSPTTSAISAEQRAINKQLRISDEEYLKRNPPEGA